MKITLTPNDQAVAIQAYLLDNYNITTYIDEVALKDMQIDIPPAWALKEEPSEASQELKPSNVVEDVKALEEEDLNRSHAIARADHLRIKYRADISTEKLIERIEEHEDTVSLIAQESEGLIKYNENTTNTSNEETHEDFLEETQEPPEEIPLNDDDDLLQEVPPKKKSIFERD